MAKTSTGKYASTRTYLANYFGKALYALSLLFACLLMPVGAVLTFLSRDWR